MIARAGVFARVVWAGVLDRTRQGGFLVSLVLMMWLGQHMLPESGAPYRTFVMDADYRPAYGAAWVGTITALLTGLWFLFVGFYLVKGGVERDRRSGVGAVLAATRMSTHTYLWARTLSNVAVFAVQSLVVAAAALVQQWLLGEDRRIDLFATLLPFVFMTGPVALFVSACAVLFDCVRFLRGGLGNIAWFFLIGFLMASSGMDRPGTPAWRDVTGARAVVDQARVAMREAHPDAATHPDEFSMGVNFNPSFKGRLMTTFAWPGMRWTPEALGSRLPLLLLAALIVFAASRVFDRFEGAARSATTRKPARWPFAPRTPHATARRGASAQALTVARKGFHPWGVVQAELALLLKGVSPWWWFIALGLAMAQCFVPMKVLTTAILPVVSFWPALLWSQLGHREKANATHDVLFSCPQPILRLLPASWLAGAIVMLLVGAPGVLRLFASGDPAAAAGWCLAAALVPAFALACGIWSGGAKLFEVLYLFIWYIGPLHQVAPLDYTGVTAERSSLLWSVYLGLTVAMAVIAWSGRQRQMMR